MRQKKRPRVVHSYEEQIILWVSGESVHSDHRFPSGECCPDYSCCQEGMDIAPYSQRVKQALKNKIKLPVALLPYQ